MPQPTALSAYCRRLLLLQLIFLSCIHGLFSQQTNPSRVFDSVKSYIEKNYAGFTDKVNVQTKKAYQAHTKRSYEYARRARSAGDQYFAIHHWLTFFKDHHLSIIFPVDTTYTEKVQIDDRQIQQLYHASHASVEGIYYYGDSVYKVAVIKSKNGVSSYEGIILNSKTPLRKAGQVKFELIETGANQFIGKWYNRAHAMSFSSILFNPEKGLSDEGWIKHSTIIKTDPAAVNRFEEENQLSTFFKKLNDSTGYLRIKSFDGSYAHNIDSVINANMQSIQSMPRLIIDLRWNGGGSDHCMSFLKPILYTNPIKNIGVDLLTTPDNTAAWERAINQYRGQLPNDYLDDALKRIHKGDGKARAIVNFESDNIDTLPAVWANPAKVAIIINGGCGSTTEEFLLFARQSKKVTIAGEHSVGSLDYSNVVRKDFSAPSFTIVYPTTRSRRINAGLGIDNKGIQPNIPLNLKANNWLDELVKRW